MIIGITGGIGSGKSTVAKYLIDKGFDVIDADLISREILTPGFGAYDKVVSAFGDEILLETGEIDRKSLGTLIFENNENKQLLDSIMHGSIKEISLERAKAAEMSSQYNVAFIDAALFFETNLDKMVDQVWLIDIPVKMQLSRVSLRDNLEKDEIMKRIHSQMKREEKLAKADVVIDNTKDKRSLYSQLDLLIDKITGDKKR